MAMFLELFLIPKTTQGQNVYFSLFRYTPPLVDFGEVVLPAIAS